MNSRTRGTPCGVFAIVAVLTKAAYAFCQEQKGAVLVRPAAAYLKEFLLRAKMKTSFLLENATVLAQTFDVNRIGIFRVVRWGNGISSQQERSPLLHNSCQLLVRHPDSETNIGLFARALRPLGNFKFSTAVARAIRLLFVLFTVDPLEAAKQAVKAASYQTVVETSKGGSKSVIGVTDLQVGFLIEL